ncbi:MAG: peptidoglycan-binding domain-containing protein [Ferruginibacter sp.]
MTSFKFNISLLNNLLKLNQFKLPQSSLVFIGIRGGVVADATNQLFQSEHTISILDINFLNPRCTILQWNTSDNTFAAFPASTVPHQRFIKSAIANNGVGVNCLMTGLFTDYRKGFHKVGSPTGHEAFRQNAPHPIRRTADDIDFEIDDRIEIDNPFDNIHCGWFDSLTSDSYSSLGCQVIMGFPKCKKPGREKNIGPWKNFRENAYNIPQNSFPYILLTGQEISKVASASNLNIAKLRFGSSGSMVEQLQTKLKQKHFYEGNIDGDFGERTLKAVIAFQKYVFGDSSIDGVVGPITSEELELDLSL